MKHFLFIVAVAAALLLTYSGTEALMIQVDAAEGVKSSVITFVLMLGFALLGPALLAAAIFFHRRSDSRGASQQHVPATHKPVYHPYLHGH